MDSDRSNKQSLPVPPFPRDSRGSLEVFSPSTYTSRPTNPVFQSSSTWKNLEDARTKLEQVKEEEPKLQPLSIPNEITSWMALPDPAPSVHKTIQAIPTSKEVDRQLKIRDTTSKAEQRAAEWGLVLQTDDETGKPQGVSVRSSGGDEPNPKPETSRRESGGSVRSSGDSSDGGYTRNNFPRVSEDLKDALSTFQQTFVVSDASKADYPILYASEGFFKMTGYNSREVIGRNCRFLQGAETDSQELEKIREALGKGNNYCGRLLNYKKDGTPFWNLLTIAPIKDETGKVLKYIGMQVEVSKHTEGSKDKMVRPNGLPESLIRYDASASSEKARALSESGNRPIRRKSGGADEKQRLQSQLRRNSEHVPPTRRMSLERLSVVPEKKPKRSKRRSFMGILKKSKPSEEIVNDGEAFDDKGSTEDDDYDYEDDDVRPDSVDDKIRKKEMRKGIDLATTLERIEKNFVITDPRLPDNPIFLRADRVQSRRNSGKKLQGPETNQETVRRIRDAIHNETEVTVQLINYTKTGKKFWNVFHLQPMRDQKGEVQYFIGVQLDGSKHVEPLQNSIPVAAVTESEKVIKETAQNVDVAVRELPDANKKPEDLWAKHSKVVQPKPHRKDSASWKAIQKVKESGEPIGLKHFKPVKPLGFGDTGSVHLVELCGTGEYFAMKSMDKSAMLNRNKVHRACAERQILDTLDHPFLPALYASFQTQTHICLITDYCPGGELFLLLDRQPTKVLKEDAVRFYAAEVIVALEYLHCQGIIYRDLKPENILIQKDGHITLTDFDLSCLTSCMPQLLLPDLSDKKRHKAQQTPIFLAEPMRASNSFVGTEEYIAPEIIGGAGHTSAVDWWALGILIYEMLYGFTPFRGKTRQKTFTNVLQKTVKFPSSKQVSLHGKQLIYELLQKDPKNRLGACEGANEIKRHPFFHGVNWALVRCEKPPELDAPYSTDPEKEAKITDPEMLDLQTNVF
ncbi:Phototropin-1 [Bienertia sinuspersici]